MFEAQDDLGCVEAHFFLREDTVLREVVVEIATIHQIQNEAQLLRRLKCIRHADDEGASFLLAKGNQKSTIL